MEIEIKYPRRSEVRNFENDWDVKVNYKNEFPTKADIERNYVKLPIDQSFWDAIGLSEETFKPWVLDKIFQLMNKYGTNPMSTDEMQNWIKENKGSHTSMSVGDVIIIDNNIYVCATVGWKEV